MTADSDPAYLYVYVIPPIDRWYGWTNLSKVPSDVRYASEGVGAFLNNTARKEWRDEVDRLLFQGRKYAETHLGYRGDIDRGPFLSLLPARGEAVPLVAWTSAEIDLTFVASPVPLPHLETMRQEVDELRANPSAEEHDEGYKAFLRSDD